MQVISPVRITHVLLFPGSSCHFCFGQSLRKSYTFFSFDLCLIGGVNIADGDSEVVEEEKDGYRWLEEIEMSENFQIDEIDDDY